MRNLKTAIKSVGVAVAARLGTFAGTWLVATWGIQGDLATQIGAGLTAGMLVGLDMLTGKYLKDA